MKQIMLIVFMTSMLVSCSKNDNIGIETILKAHKIKVKDKRSNKDIKEQKCFPKNSKITVEEAIVEFGEKTNYKNQIIIIKGDIVNPKEIVIERTKK